MTFPRVLEDGAGWADRRGRGRVRIDGTQAASFLHDLVSNDVARLTPGTGCYATYLTPQGRMIADMRIYHRGDHLLLDVAPGIAAPLTARFDALIFSEDARVRDVSGTAGALSVVGPGSAVLLARALRLDAAALAALEPLSQLSREIDPAGDFNAEITRGIDFVSRTDDAPVESFDVFLPLAHWDAVIAALESAGGVLLPLDVLEGLRIDAARPAFGIDITTETIPLEAGLLERGISTTKGCYVGQEVIIRVLHRGGGRVAKRLMQLVCDESVLAAPAAGAAITLDGETIGQITSAARSPVRARIVALGYVRRDDAEVGRRVMIGGAAAEITRAAG